MRASGSRVGGGYEDSSFWTDQVGFSGIPSSSVSNWGGGEVVDEMKRLRKVGKEKDAIVLARIRVSRIAEGLYSEVFMVVATGGVPERIEFEHSQERSSYRNLDCTQVALKTGKHGKHLRMNE